MNNGRKERLPTADQCEPLTGSEELGPDLAQVNAYAKVKQAIARDLHYLREMLHQRGNEQQDSRCRDLMAKLAEDHFTLAVLGQFKRGKSSLMNAIIGRPLLPTGVLPLTSAITVLRFGPRERLVVERRGSRSLFTEEAPLSRLSDYVTEKGNPANQKGIARAIIETPCPFLRRGLEFVDTPGIGSAIEANTEITRQFLPQCDAVVFITSVDAPLSKTETDFFQEIREHVRKVFFVVNKTDLLGQEERDEVLQFVSQNLRAMMGADSLRVFTVSCQRALEAKLSENPVGYAKSGMKDFEEALSDFLATGKMYAFLVSILDRAMDVAAQELLDIELEMGASEAPEKNRRTSVATLETRLRRLRESRERTLADLRQQTGLLVQEKAKREMQAILACERELLRNRFTEELDRSRWKLAHGVVKHLASETAKHLNASLDEWADMTMKNVRSVFVEMLRRETKPLLEQLRAIPDAAAEVFGLEPDASARRGEREEIDVKTDDRPLWPRRFQWKRRPPLFIRIWQRGKNLPNKHVPSSSATSLIFWVLPVSLFRSRVERFVLEEAGFMVNLSKSAVCEAVNAKIEEMLDNATAQIGERAKNVEDHVLQTVAGGDRTAPTLRPRNRESIARLRERFAELRRRMDTLRNRILQSNVPQAGAMTIPQASTEAAILPEPAPAAEAPPKIDEGDIVRDLRTRGCPVCDRADKAMFHFFAHWQYELYGNEQSQNLYAAEGGLCPLHTWQLAAIASPQGISQGYPRLIERIARELAHLASTDVIPAGKIASLIPTSQRCRACRELRLAEIAYLDRFAPFLQTGQGVVAYERSQGLCLRHLGLLLSQNPPPVLQQRLLRHASRILNAMAEDIQSYTLKRDALRRSLHNQDEDDAYMRALIHLAGARYLAVPWKASEE